MSRLSKKLTREAGFVFWENETWGKGPAHIDWSCDYDEALEKYTELIVRTCAKMAQDAADCMCESISDNVLIPFGYYEEDEISSKTSN